MKKLKFLCSFLLLLCPAIIYAQKAKVYEVKSPDGKRYRKLIGII